MVRDSLGDRMKIYENQESARKLIPKLPVLARLDGRCFRSFTRGLARPYDERLSNLMIETTKFLVEETDALMGYTQSDEITLSWYSERYDSKVFFDGRTQKMTSILASLTSSFFNKNLETYLPEKKNKLPVFDCRVWNVPTLEEAANCFLWREQDATKNSISMSAQSLYSHKELMNKHSGDMMEMLFAKGVNWNDYPAFFKRGTFVRKEIVEMAFSDKEIDKLPKNHEARKNPDLKVIRSEIKVLSMPAFGKVTNRVGVIFHVESPVLGSE